VAEATRFRPGDRVWVRDDEKPGHVRTPHYIRGKTGEIAAVHGVFRNPELLAYGKDGFPKRPLYLVGFRQSDVWPDRYAGSRQDRVYVDIYEHWLEPAEGRK
jgi:hypothetical protein